jgi:hypothetical protein
MALDDFLAVLDSKTTTSQIVKRFQAGLVFKAHKLWYHSTLCSKAMKKKKKKIRWQARADPAADATFERAGVPRS